MAMKRNGQTKSKKKIVLSPINLESIEMNNEKLTRSSVQIIIYLRKELNPNNQDGQMFTNHYLVGHYDRTVSWSLLIMINHSSYLLALRDRCQLHYKQFRLWCDEKENVQNALLVIEGLWKRVLDGKQWSHKLSNN